MTETPCSASESVEIYRLVRGQTLDPLAVDGRIRFDCAGCGSRLRVRPEYLGLMVTCKTCSHQFVASKPTGNGTDPSHADDKIQLECPGCRKHLKVRPTYLGSTVLCNGCGHRFIASKRASNQTAPAREVETIPFECPGCRQPLRMRPEHVGSQVLCKRCKHPFVALRPLDVDTLAGSKERIQNQGNGAAETVQRASSVEVPAKPAEERDLAERQIELLRFELEELRRHNGELANRNNEANDRWLTLQTRLGTLEQKSPNFLEQLTDLQERLRALEASSARWTAIREHIDELREQNHSHVQRSADDREALRIDLSELGAKHESIRAALAEHAIRQDRLQSESVQLRAIQNEELRCFATRWEELEAKFGVLEAAPLPHVEQVAHLHERLQAVEESSGRWDVISKEISFLRDQNRTLMERNTEDGKVVSSNLRALGAAHDSILATLGVHGGRQDQLESAVARLEASQQQTLRSATERWAEIEAESCTRWKSVDERHSRLQQIGNDHAERLGRIETYLGRIDSMIADSNSFRRELAGFRFEHDALKHDVLQRVSHTQLEIGKLRDELESGKSLALPVALPSDDAKRNVTAHLPTTTAVVVETDLASPQIECDLLAENLIRERLVGQSEQTATSKSAATDAAASKETNRHVPVAHHGDLPEYRRIGDLFDQCMKSKNFAEAVKAARYLVAYSREWVGEQTLEHALWLRNLAMSLSLTGGVDEARQLLHRASEICRLNLESDSTPYTVCLLDLSEFYLEAGDRRSAAAFCEQAMEILGNVSGNQSPLKLRAERCMARTGTLNFHGSPMSTVSIST